MKTISCFSMLGGRASIIDIHLKLLKENFSNDVEHFLLLPDANRYKTIDVCKNYNHYFNFIKRESIAFNTKFPDGTYDNLLNKYCNTEKFVLLHDDTFIYKKKLRVNLDKLSNEFEFGGAIDNAAVGSNDSPYNNIYFNGVPFSKIRIGTWFLFGDYRIYKNENYSLGSGGFEYPILSNIKYKTLRLSVRRPRIWIDGGFNFNINARIDNKKIHIFDNDFGAEHFTRCTNFFISRGLGKSIDSVDEIDIWKNRIKILYEKGNINQIKKDISFMKKMASFIEKNNSFDSLLNIDTILELIEPIKDTHSILDERD